MLEEAMQRSIALLGREKIEKIANCSVMVIGCGAVGGYALEMIARLGVGTIWVVDFDVFEASNLNRQILALVSTLGRKKCLVAKERVADINPSASVFALDEKIAADNLDFILDAHPDFVIDAIDDVPAKAELMAFLCRHNIPFCSAMGAALKTKPELLKTAPLHKTEGCHLAKKLRDILRHKGIDLTQIKCVYSPEPVKICKDAGGNNVLGSLPLVPAEMGVRLAQAMLDAF